MFSTADFSFSVDTKLVLHFNDTGVVVRCDVTSGGLREHCQPSILIAAGRGQHFPREPLPPRLIPDFIDAD